MHVVGKRGRERVQVRCSDLVAAIFRKEGRASPEDTSVVVLFFAIPGGRDSPAVFATVVTPALYISCHLLRAKKIRLQQNTLRLLILSWYCTV